MTYDRSHLKGRRPTPETVRRGAIFNELYNGRGWTLQRISDQYGITRERVRQILVACGYKSGRPVRIEPDPYCTICLAQYRKGHYREHCDEAGHRFSKGTRPEAFVERNNAVVRDYLTTDLTTREIAEKYGMGNQEEIYPILHRRGIVPDRGGGKYERTPEIRAKLSASNRERWRDVPPGPIVAMRLRGISRGRIMALGIYTENEVDGALSRYKKRNQMTYPPADDTAPIGPNEPTGTGDPTAFAAGSPDPR